MLQKPEFCAAMIEKQPVFRPAGEHAVRFVGALGYEIIDQYADVAFIPLNQHRRSCSHLIHSVYSRD